MATGHFLPPLLTSTRVPVADLPVGNTAPRKAAVHCREHRKLWVEMGTWHPQITRGGCLACTRFLIYDKPKGRNPLEWDGIPEWLNAVPNTVLMAGGEPRLRSVTDPTVLESKVSSSQGAISQPHVGMTRCVWRGQQS
jgi:hypothetical protein